MKKLLCVFFVAIFIAGSALGEGFNTSSTPITIDGVRVAFFDAAGNLIQPVEKDGLVYVPLEAFCESVGLEIIEADGKITVIRPQAAAAAQANNAPATAEKGRVALHTGNFNDYFAYNVVHQNFKVSKEHTGTLGTVNYYHINTSADIVLTAYPKTSVESDNVSIQVQVFLDGLSANECGMASSFYMQADMPVTGTLTHTIQLTGSRGMTTTAPSTMDSPTGILSAVDGCIWLDKAAADEANADSFAKAEDYLQKDYVSSAEEIFKALTAIDYPGAAEKLAETQARAAEIKAAEEAAAIAAAEKAAAEEAAAKAAEEADRKAAYEAAQALLDAGDYEAAQQAFEELGEYLDSSGKVQEAREKIKAADYAQAQAYEQQGLYDEAIAIYTALGAYEDASQRVTACEQSKIERARKEAYDAAAKLEAEGEYEAARDAFVALGGYSDSAARAEALNLLAALNEARKLLAEHNTKDPLELLEPYVETSPEAEALYWEAAFRRYGTEQPLSAEGTGWVAPSTTEWALMDYQGKVLWKLDPNESLVTWDWNDDFYLVHDKKHTYYRYLDTMGREAFGQTFVKAQPFYQGKALVTKVDGQMYVINTLGEDVCQLPQKEGRVYKEYVGEDLVSFAEGGKWGLINLKGKVVLKPKYNSSIGKFQYGLSVVSDIVGKKQGCPTRPDQSQGPGVDEAQ